jgi:hypothetical protein
VSPVLKVSQEPQVLRVRKVSRDLMEPQESLVLKARKEIWESMD